MTDAELAAKKLAFVETCVRELRTLARPERIAEDVREQRFVEHTLQARDSGRSRRGVAHRVRRATGRA